MEWSETSADKESNSTRINEGKKSKQLQDKRVSSEGNKVKSHEIVKVASDVSAHY